jgi:hypothetical protein
MSLYEIMGNSNIIPSNSLPLKEVTGIYMSRQMTRSAQLPTGGLPAAITAANALTQVTPATFILPPLNGSNNAWKVTLYASAVGQYNGDPLEFQYLSFNFSQGANTANPQQFLTALSELKWVEGLDLSYYLTYSFQDLLLQSSVSAFDLTQPITLNVYISQIDNTGISINIPFTYDIGFSCLPVYVQ